MDYIINKLNSYIQVAETKTVERQTLMRERIEYMLFLALGCLWNVCLGEMNDESRKQIVMNLKKMSIGEVVSALRELDTKNQFLTKKGLKVLNKYPELRNEALGHGYTHGDIEENLEEKLEALYQELIQIDFFSREYQIVLIRSCNEEKYEGIRFSPNSGGIPCVWSCPREVLGKQVKANELYLLDDEMKYYRVTPFVYIFDNGESVYVFQSLEDKLSGNIKMNQLFKSSVKNVNADDFVSVSKDSERRRISANGTIMNYYKRNYSNFIAMPLEKKIKDFLRQNRSNVQATIWGHGGVGKTACVQKICMDLFNDFQNEYSYIVFVSAKDRMYETETGSIKRISGIQTYDEILDKVLEVVYDEDATGTVCEKEERILCITSRTLIVIDDYETFEDRDKEKIQDLINRLNIDHFKILVTTRNKRFSSGVEIKMDELDIVETKTFILDIFRKEYPKYVDKIYMELSDENTMIKIHQATSGRVLFLYQFANLYAQRGLDEQIVLELKSSDNAKEFLYGRVYAYLGDWAKKEFMTISQITDERNLIFKEEVLFFLLGETENDDLEEGIQELIEQKIIERYDRENYRVYSKDLLDKMYSSFMDASEVFKDSIKNRIHTIGGKNVKGSVYEAMLDEANASRYVGNVKDTLQKYKQILNDKKCEKRVLRKALLNLTSYISINLGDNEQTIHIFDEYIYDLGFQEDVDVIRMYVQYLWRSDDIAKTKACDILDRFFRSKKHKKTSDKNLELFTYAVNYCSHNAIENTPEKVKSSAENRIINEYGSELFEWVSQRDFNEFKPSVRHNISLALIATVKLAKDLNVRGYDKEVLIQQIREYGMSCFNEIFRKQLERLCEDRNISVLESGEVDARVTYIARYGILVEIDNLGRAIIHNTEMERSQRKAIKRGAKVKAKVIGQNEKGYILSLKGL